MTPAEITQLLPELQGCTHLDEAAYAKVPVLLQERHRYLPFPPLAEGERRVRAERMSDLWTALERLVKRAKKLGVPEPEVHIARREALPVVVTFPHGGEWCWARTGAAVEFAILVPSVEPVKLPGWTFVATIEHLGEDGNLLRTTPSCATPLPAAYRTDPPTCDACHRQRRRLETFVLRHDDGHYARVGRNCLQDYLGDASAAQIVGAATLERALDDLLADDWDGEGGGGWGGARAVIPVTFLASVATIVEHVGWCSRRVAREKGTSSTADLAWRRLLPAPGKASAEELEIRNLTVTDAHREDAAKALAWARDLPIDGDSDFLHNCRIVAGLPAWDASKVGIGAAILTAYLREQERLARVQHERRLPSVPYGVVGERFGVRASKKLPILHPTLRARVLGVYAREGDYGLTTIVRLQAPSRTEGHVHDLVWFASGEVPIVIDEGAVAAHDAAENRRIAAQYAWLHADERVRMSRYDAEMTSDERVPLLHAASAALAELKAAEAATSATHGPARDAVRSIQVGDVVDVVATVKRQGTSGRTGRMETHLSRCVLRWIPEPLDP